MKTKLALAVVTLTRPGQPHQWYAESVASVRAALPIGAEHHIIECASFRELEPCRWAALDLAEFVCFVDDDDRVINNSLNHCLQALVDNPQTAVAFTDERYVNAQGDTLTSIHEPNRKPHYEQVAHSPQIIHHLTMLRTSQIDRTVQRLATSLGVGLDWLLKASCAVRGGAIHVPIEGYEWRKRGDQYSKSQDFLDHYGSKLHLMQAYLRAQLAHTGPIPRYVVPGSH